jgi:hypothetical protein
MYWISYLSTARQATDNRRSQIMTRNRKNNAPVIENLETRTLMSATPLGISEVPFNLGGTQLRITGTSGNDQITVKQTSAGLVIGNTGGWTTTVNDTNITSLWINGQAGNNSVVLDASVTINAMVFGGGVNDSIVSGSGNDTLYGGTGKNNIQARGGNDTLVCLGSTADTLVGGTGKDSFWTDNSAAEKIENANGGTVHRVGGFYNASSITVSGKKISATKAVVAGTSSIKEPVAEAGDTYTNFSNDPIFSSAGPSANDIYQGNDGDCYYLSVLSSVAKVDPSRISQSILDLGDGTVVVQLVKNGKTVYVHEDEQLPTYNGMLDYAGLGAQNSTWVALMEKAWCYVRTNSASYASIDSGWMSESYQALGATNITSTYSVANGNALLTLIGKDLAAGLSVTYATTNNVAANSDMVAGHAYMVSSVTTDSKGNVTSVTLRNPWGVDADMTGNGYVTLTAAQALSDFSGIVSASV